MRISGISTHGSSAARIGSAALFALLVTLAMTRVAAAAPCMEDAYGGDTNCTANDFGVASVTVTNLIEGCDSEGDTFTFDGALNIDGTSGGNADRYDVGFYIGADGIQALSGTCTVAIIPNTTLCLHEGNLVACNIDSDTCGDYFGSAEVSVPVGNVTAACVDQDNDGFFDLAICAAYGQNEGQDPCDSAAEAIPGTAAKCDCRTVNTNQEIPHCDVNTDCVTDNNICTDEVCLGLNEPGADFFGCAHVNNTVPCRTSAGVCDIQENCSGGSCPADSFSSAQCRAGTGVCDPAETCTGASATCPADGFLPSSTVCRASGGVCDIAENCTGSSAACPAPGFTDAGTTCRASAGVCDVAEVCTGSTATCPGDSFLTTQCRASAGVCDVAENCSGASANCPADGFVSSNTVCRADAGECDVAELCTGSSAPCPAQGFEPAGTGCSTDGNVCTDDECDGNGNCDHNDNTDPCNDGLFCTDSDVCAGGACNGVARDCSDAIDCSIDACDEANDECDHTADDAFCDDGDPCTDDICSLQNDCISDLICEDVCRSPGYWATHSGYEKKNSINVGQLVLDAAGGLEICGQTVDATSNDVDDAPFLSGLGLSSNLQALCMRSKGVKQRQLMRQLTAAALNCVMSNGSNCDDIVERYIDVSWSDCNTLCETGVQAIGGPSVGQCIGQLDCFNNGGQIINGDCAFGFCEGSETPCGGDSGDCGLDDQDQPIECVEFEDNCHSNALCKESIGVCPKSTPASSSGACREARGDACTIDSCN